MTVIRLLLPFCPSPSVALQTRSTKRRSGSKFRSKLWKGCESDACHFVRERSFLYVQLAPKLLELEEQETRAVNEEDFDRALAIKVWKAPSAHLMLIWVCKLISSCFDISAAERNG